MRWDAILYIQQRSVVQQSARTHAHAQDLLSKKGGHTKYVSHHHSMQGHAWQATNGRIKCSYVKLLLYNIQ